MHAGPYAARAFRAQQIRQLAAGSLSPEDFARYEARRAANRLRDRWKKNRWTPGRTLDLGEHERLFQATITESSSMETTGMAPATVDTARWKFRRFMIDRQQFDRWETWCRNVLRSRVEADGPAPPGHDPSLSDASPAAFVVESRPTAYSKRTRLDPSRRAAAVPRVSPKRGRPRKPTADEAEALRDHLAENWRDLRCVLGDDVNDEALAFETARLHRAMLRQEPRALDEWVGHLITLRQRP